MKNKAFEITFSDASTKIIYLHPNTSTNNEGSPTLAQVFNDCATQMNVNTATQTFTFTLSQSTGRCEISSSDIFTLDFTSYPDAAKAFGPIDAGDRARKELMDAALDYWREGCPDLDTAPEPDRLAALESGVKALAEQAANRADQLDRVATRVALLTERVGGISCVQQDDRVLSLSLDARVAALERERPQSPSEPVTPEPPRFVPTAPGWYWCSTGGATAYPAWWEPGLALGGLKWLAPVAPYAPPTRTEEEARREPRRGDRWRSQHYEYTVLGTQGASWPLLLRDGGVGSCFPGRVGEPGETYLGNFAHELEAP